MIDEKQLIGVEKLTCSKLSSIALLSNSQNDKYTQVNLPITFQIGPIKTMLKLGQHFVTAGNFYGTDAQFGRLDSSIGNVLNYKNKLLEYSKTDSGLIIDGDVRKLFLIKGKKNNKMLVSRNNSDFLLYQINF
jgi:enediyne biosynthesis protein E4